MEGALQAELESELSFHAAAIERGLQLEQKLGEAAVEEQTLSQQLAAASAQSLLSIIFGMLSGFSDGCSDFVINTFFVYDLWHLQHPFVT